MNIFIVGVGMGDTKYLTKIAEEKIKNADIIIGAKRVAEPYVNEKKVFRVIRHFSAVRKI